MSYLSLATGHCHVYEASSVEHPLPSAPFGDLLLLLWFDLWSLVPYFAGTGEGAMNLAHVCGLSLVACLKRGV